MPQEIFLQNRAERLKRICSTKCADRFFSERQCFYKVFNRTAHYSRVFNLRKNEFRVLMSILENVRDIAKYSFILPFVIYRPQFPFSFVLGSAGRSSCSLVILSPSISSVLPSPSISVHKLLHPRSESQHTSTLGSNCYAYQLISSIFPYQYFSINFSNGYQNVHRSNSQCRSNCHRS